MKYKAFLATIVAAAPMAFAQTDESPLSKTGALIDCYSEIFSISRSATLNDDAQEDFAYDVPVFLATKNEGEYISISYVDPFIAESEGAPEGYSYHSFKSSTIKKGEDGRVVPPGIDISTGPQEVVELSEIDESVALAALKDEVLGRLSSVPAVFAEDVETFTASKKNFLHGRPRIKPNQAYTKSILDGCTVEGLPEDVIQAAKTIQKLNFEEGLEEQLERSSVELGGGKKPDAKKSAPKKQAPARKLERRGYLTH
jgi:hypothetical protein